MGFIHTVPESIGQHIDYLHTQIYLQCWYIVVVFYGFVHASMQCLKMQNTTVKLGGITHSFRADLPNILQECHIRGGMVVFANLARTAFDFLSIPTAAHESSSLDHNQLQCAN